MVSSANRPLKTHSTVLVVYHKMHLESELVDILPGTPAVDVPERTEDEDEVRVPLVPPEVLQEAGQAGVVTPGQEVEGGSHVLTAGAAVLTDLGSYEKSARGSCRLW